MVFSKAFSLKTSTNPITEYDLINPPCEFCVEIRLTLADNSNGVSHLSIANL